MKMRKGFAGICAAAALSLSMTAGAFAGEWQFQEGGEYWQWKYVEQDGSCKVNEWKEIDGKWYHFDDEGYIDAGGIFVLPPVNGDNTRIGEYYMMLSGALETNRDFGSGYVDGEGRWSWTCYDVEQAENLCRSWGIDMDWIYNGCRSNPQTTYSCPTALFPRDSEGNPAYAVVARTIYFCADSKSPTDGGYDCDWSGYSRWYWGDNHGTFTIVLNDGPIG